MSNSTMNLPPGIMNNVQSVTLSTGLTYWVGMKRPEKEGIVPHVSIVGVLVEEPEKNFLHYRIVSRDSYTGKHTTQDYFYSGGYLVVSESY